MRFEREGKRPDGSAVKVAFSLAFAADKFAPDIHFATCQQHYPENFWNPAFQKHANSVTGIAGAVVVAEEPEEHRTFFEAFTGAPAQAATGWLFHRNPARHHRRDGAGRLLAPLRGQAAGCERRRAAGGAALSECRCGTRCRRAPSSPVWPGSMPAMPSVIGAEDAMGAVLVFEPAETG